MCVVDDVDLIHVCGCVVDVMCLCVLCVLCIAILYATLFVLLCVCLCVCVRVKLGLCALYVQHCVMLYGTCVVVRVFDCVRVCSFV